MEKEILERLETVEKRLNEIELKLKLSASNAELVKHVIKAVNNSKVDNIIASKKSYLGY